MSATKLYKWVKGQYLRQVPERMKETRRGFVSASALSLVAGCLGRRDGSSRTDETETTKASERGRAPEVSVRKETWGSDVEYVEENGSVRYDSGRASPTDRSGTRTEPAYSVVPFSQWASAQCAALAASKVNSVLDERIESGLTGVSAGVNHSSEGKEVYVDYSTTRNRDGEVVEKPEAAFESVVEATPRTVAATVALSGETRTERYRIFVRTSTKRRQ